MTMEIAKTIKEQLGGNRFAMMTGAKNFVAMSGMGGLKFSIPTSKKINMVMVTLNGNDTYDVKFMKFSKKTFTCQTVVENNDVYADMLEKVFTSATGLYTRF